MLLYIYIYGNMDPINIPPMLVYIIYMDPMVPYFQTNPNKRLNG